MIDNIPSPLYASLSYCETAVVLKAFQGFEPILLESTALSSMGRYSFLAIDPFHVIESRQKKVKIINMAQTSDLFTLLKRISCQYPLKTLPNLPPFQGGMAGFLGYELGTYLETVPRALNDDLDFPDCRFGCYDLVFAWDHHQKTLGLFSSGYPEKDVSLQQQRAKERLNWAKSHLSKQASVLNTPFSVVLEPLRSNFSESAYQETVKRIREYILAGDIFQANLTQRFETTAKSAVDLINLYHKLSQINPAPFAGFYAFDDYAILSASPERLVSLHNGVAEACPIKGTVSRDPNPKIDAANAKWLLESEKDKAENTMIVDLLRNDLSRVCLPNHVRVKALCALQSFATVHHLVSTITGTLAPSSDAMDLIRAIFPGGSITGAPKIRAMEIIAEQEKLVRGPYCGSLGYIGFDGNADFSILIRTFVIKGKQITFHAGGAITLDSDPLAEYQETLVKAKALKQTLFSANHNAGRRDAIP